MNKMDIDLITGFLSAYIDEFAAYLDDHDIEPTEGDVIIEKLQEARIDD